MDKLVGVYNLGGRNVEIYCIGEWGGYFCNSPTGTALPDIRVGLASQNWGKIVTALLHELTEFEMHNNGYRYDRSNNYGDDLCGYTFMMSHSQFSDICARVAKVLVQVLPALAEELKKYQKECSEITKKEKLKAKRKK
jgi:hypothetical protein